MTARFSSKDLKEALGSFTTGVAIAATSHNGQNVGITISSFASVSLDPPLILFSANRALKSFDYFLKVPGFAINILTQEQAELSNRFACSGGDKWSGVEGVEGEYGGIIIQPALASFDCKLHQMHDGGDHVIFVGEIVNLFADSKQSPLVYYRSKYRELVGIDPAVAII